MRFGERGRLLCDNERGNDNNTITARSGVDMLSNSGDRSCSRFAVRKVRLLKLKSATLGENSWLFPVKPRAAGTNRSADKFVRHER